MKNEVVSKTLALVSIFLFISIIITPIITGSNFVDDTTPPITTHTLDPPTPDGENGWYVSDVEVTLTATDDISGVNTTYYRVDGGEWLIYNSTFVIYEDGYDILMEYYSVDNANNQEPINQISFDMDQTKPYIYLKQTINIKPFSYNLTKFDITTVWTIIQNATATDEMSGMERVEFYLNERLQETVYGPGPYYVWSFKYPVGLNMRLPAYAYDNAGNWAWDEIIEPGLINFQQSKQSIKLPTSDSEENCIDCQSNGKTHLAEKLLNRLEKNEVLSKIIDSYNFAYDRPICEFLLKWALYYNDLGWYYFYSGHYFIGKIYLGISSYIYYAGALLLCWPVIP